MNLFYPKRSIGANSLLLKDTGKKWQAVDVTIYYFFSYCSIVCSLTFESSSRAQRQAVNLTSFFLKISECLCSSQPSTLIFEQETLKGKDPSTGAN